MYNSHLQQRLSMCYMYLYYIAYSRRCQHTLVRPKAYSTRNTKQGAHHPNQLPRLWEHFEGRGPNEWLLEPRPKVGVGT